MGDSGDLNPMMQNKVFGSVKLCFQRTLIKYQRAPKLDKVVREPLKIVYKLKNTLFRVCRICRGKQANGNLTFQSEKLLKTHIFKPNRSLSSYLFWWWCEFCDGTLKFKSIALTNTYLSSSFDGLHLEGRTMVQYALQRQFSANLKMNFGWILSAIWHMLDGNRRREARGYVIQSKDVTRVRLFYRKDINFTSHWFGAIKVDNGRRN